MTPLSANNLLCSYLLLQWLWSLCSAECATELRVRRPWHSLSNREQMLFVTGYQTLNRESILQKFISSHKKAATGNPLKLHYTSLDFYWHSYWLYEFENAIRDLGGEYECFAMPYWDVTKDEAYWNQTENPDINKMPIYGGNLGGDGDIDNDYCVGEPWSLEQYTTHSLCADDEEPKNCCLKRHHIDHGDPAGTARLHSKAEFTKKIFTDSDYKYFGNFTSAISTMHGGVHWFFATVNGTHFNQMAGQVAADPLFPVFHAFIDYIRLMRTDCYQFDLVAASALDSAMPYSYYADPAQCALDYAMDFSILCDGTKRMCSEMDITPRLMYDISPNTEFNVVYELGDFWNDNEELNSMCSEYLNSSWWTDTVSNRDIVVENVVQSDGESVIKRVHSGFVVEGFLVLIIALLVMALLKYSYSIFTVRDKKLQNDAGDLCNYGAV